MLQYCCLYGRACKHHQYLCISLASQVKGSVSGGSFLVLFVQFAGSVEQGVGRNGTRATFLERLEQCREFFCFGFSNL